MDSNGGMVVCAVYVQAYVNVCACTRTHIITFMFLVYACIIF